MERQSVAPITKIREREAPPIEIGGPWVVILYNCDCHTFDEVIAQLQKATGCSQAKAEQIAEEAHQRGRAIAYTGDEDECGRVAGILRSIRLQVETDLF
jgi:ATP-dependent Clp protease adaptor protein ClpS